MLGPVVVMIMMMVILMVCDDANIFISAHIALHFALYGADEMAENYIELLNSTALST